MTQIKKDSCVPVYKQLGQVLRQQWSAGRLRPGDRIPSENELCRRFDISRMTARAALLELEKEGWVSSVLGKGRFVKAEGSGRAEQSKDTSSLTVAVYPFFNVSPATTFYFSGLLNGLARGFHHHRVRSTFFREEEIRASSLSRHAFFTRNGVDGLIWGSPSRRERLEIQALENEGLPVVVLNEDGGPYGLDYVTCNHHQGARQMTEHLIHLGHRAIGCLTVSRDLDYAERRWQGYTDAHTHNGLSADPRLTVQIDDLTRQDRIDRQVGEHLARLKSSGPWPTAWFIASGAMVPGITRFVQTEGLSVPGDLSLAAFDEVTPEPGYAKITCVRQPLEALGETAVDVLVKKIRGKKAKPVQITLDPVFILGSSCLPLSKRP